MYSFLKAFLVLMKLLSLSQFYAPKFISAIRALRKFRTVFYNFCYYLFLRSTLLLNRNKHIGNDVFV